MKQVPIEEVVKVNKTIKEFDWQKACKNNIDSIFNNLGEDWQINFS